MTSFEVCGSTSDKRTVEEVSKVIDGMLSVDEPLDRMFEGC